jgi:hypothetical protein
VCRVPFSPESANAQLAERVPYCQVLVGVRGKKPMDPKNASATDSAEASTPALLPPASDSRFVVPPPVPLPTSECRYHGYSRFLQLARMNPAHAAR